MKVYIGYVLGDYAQAVFMSKNKKTIEKWYEIYPCLRPHWIEEYELENDNLIELDCS